MLTRVHATAEVIAQNVTNDECRRHARQDSCSSRHDSIPLVMSSKTDIVANTPSAAQPSKLTGRRELIQPSPDQ